MKKQFWIAMGLFYLFFGGSVYLLEAIFRDEPPPRREPTWKPPAIEQCDKELWIRVKDGCDEH